MSTIRESMSSCMSSAEVTLESKFVECRINDDAGLLTKKARTTSFQSTVAPSSRAESCAASVRSRRSPSCERAPAPCIWQDAVWTPDVPVRGPELEQGEAVWKEWVAKVQELSALAFENDCLEMVSKKSKFKLAVLTAPTGEFLGFSVYKVNRGAGNLTIGKIAICREQRGHGYGKRMMKETIKMAKKDKMIHFCSLSSLPTAIKFYKRMNFKEFKEVKFTGVAVEEGEEFVEGQVYMEYKIRNPPKKGKGGRK